jgi:hypothetical protein
MSEADKLGRGYPLCEDGHVLRPRTPKAASPPCRQAERSRDPLILLVGEIANRRNSSVLLRRAAEPPLPLRTMVLLRETQTSKLSSRRGLAPALPRLLEEVSYMRSHRRRHLIA